MNQVIDNIIQPYTLLRASLNLFQKPPADLDADQLRQAQKQAGNEFDIETRVLNSSEALNVIVTEQEVAAAFAEIRDRFPNEEAFANALDANRLNEEGLTAALTRQCKVTSIMERVAARAPHVSEVEIGIFYHSHPEKFHLPERRSARHILISINPDYPENTRENARRRIGELAEILKRKPHKFANLALKHSECPTAFKGGELGKVVEGQLFPQLDAALFALKENQLGPVVETEIGFHLIQCQKIWPAETLSLRKATPKIKKIMEDRYRHRCQRAWLASLPTGKAVSINR